jgi:hypothetical protein
MVMDEADQYEVSMRKARAYRYVGLSAAAFICLLAVAIESWREHMVSTATADFCLMMGAMGWAAARKGLFELRMARDIVQGKALLIRNR